MSNFKKRKKTKKQKKITLQNNKTTVTTATFDFFPIEKIDLKTIPFSFKTKLIKRRRLSSASIPFFSSLTPLPLPLAKNKKEFKNNCIKGPILSYPLPDILGPEIYFRKQKRRPLGEKPFINSDCLIKKIERVDKPAKEESPFPRSFSPPHIAQDKAQIYGPTIIFHHRKKPAPKVTFVATDCIISSEVRDRDPTPKDQMTFSSPADKPSEVLKTNHLSKHLVFIIFVLSIITVSYLLVERIH